MAEMREPRGQSVAYAVGVGRGSRQPSSAASTCTIPASVGRGTAMYASGASNKYSQEMRNAQMPYEEYLVTLCCLMIVLQITGFVATSDTSDIEEDIKR